MLDLVPEARPSNLGIVVPAASRLKKRDWSRTFDYFILLAIVFCVIEQKVRPALPNSENKQRLQTHL